MTLNQVIIAARKHVGNNADMESSARICLADAVAAYDQGDYKVAYRHALKSLAYSVGIFHAVFTAATEFSVYEPRARHRFLSVTDCGFLVTSDMIQQFNNPQLTAHEEAIRDDQ